MTGDEVGTNAEELMLPRLKAFLSAMDAIRDLEEYVAENAKNLNDIATAFAREAKKSYPGVPYETHQEAGRIVHRRIHDYQAALDAAKEPGRPDDSHSSNEAPVVEKSDREKGETTEATRLFTERLKTDLTALTGDESFYSQYASIWNRTSQRPQRTRLLRNSILISAVSDFEVLVSGLVRAFLTLRPEILRTADEKYSMVDLEPFATMDEFREHCAEVMAEGLLRGGFDDWMEWFQSRHKLRVPGVTADADALVEIFQRRHLLVHNGGVVNRFYLSKVSIGTPRELGQKLGVGGPYITKAVDELTVAGIKLAVSLMLKVAKSKDEKEEIDHQLGHISYEFLSAGQWTVAERLNEWHLTFVERASTRLVAMINRWVARKNIHGTEDIRSEVEAWETDTLSGDYRLAKLALLEQHEEAYSLLRSLIASGEVGRRGWRDWPLLEGLRQYEASTIDPSDRVNPVSFNEVHVDREGPDEVESAPST